MRKTNLKVDKDGYYRRNIGFAEGRNGKISQPKISLGKQKKAAKERLARISAIWERIESSARLFDRRPFWDDLSLEIAKAIGRGDDEFAVTEIADDPYFYVRYVEAVAQQYPEIRIKPKNESLYSEGKSDEQAQRVHIERLEVEMLEISKELKAAALSEAGNDKKYVDLLGDQTLHQALDKFSDHIEEIKFDPSEGAINDTGKKKQGMIKQLKSYLDDQPLETLNNFAALDQLFGVFRNRPITHRYKKAMAFDSCKKMMRELIQFFDWMHTSQDWEWRQPTDFQRISRIPLEIETDGQYDAEDTPTYSLNELKTLFEYATPLERLLLLLGLNCAFGADQIGRMRIHELIEKNGRHYIKRVRKKKRVTGIHYLFEKTVEGINWAIKGRENQPDAHVLVNGKGNSLWRKTKSGNRCRDIPNAWYRLLNRIQVDLPDFRRLGFNALRDTSSNMIRKIGGAEVASIHLTHRHQSRDRNLLRYTNPPRKKHFRAQRKLELQLADVFESEGNPWADREHQYLTQAQIKTMWAMLKEKAPVGKIADEISVAPSTVYRWIDRRNARPASE